MSIQILALIFTSVTLSAAAQVALKAGMSGSKVTMILREGSLLTQARVVLTTPMVALGLAIYGLGALLWLVVLARIELSRAYPFVGFGFLLTMAFAALSLGESLPLLRIVGTVLVTVGIVLVALD